MNSSSLLIAITSVSAVGASILAWLLVDAGGKALRKYQQNFTVNTRFQVQEFFLYVEPTKLFVAQLCLMVLGFCLAWLLTRSLVISAVTLVLLGFFPRFVYARMRQRRLRKFEEQLPDALLLLASGLRAGLSFHTATTQVVEEIDAPLGQEFGLMLREQRLGLPQDQCLASLVHRVPTPTTVLVTAAIRIALETGGGLAEMLEHTASTVRQRLQMEGKIQALTAQGRAQAWVTGLMPVLMMLIFEAMGQDTFAFLLDSQIGWATIAVLLLLEGVGVYLIRKIVRIDV
jgi:tight adherence protein B